MNDSGLSETEAALIAAALSAREKAYAPYSNFPVGAALLSTNGNMVTGVNVENASYGLTMCAERVAVGAAVVHGHRTFSHIAIASRGAVSPCGACRQVLAQFGGDIQVLLVDAEYHASSHNGPNDSTEAARSHATRLRRVSLSQLLPDAFVFNEVRE